MVRLSIHLRAAFLAATTCTLSGCPSDPGHSDETAVVAGVTSDLTTLSSLDVRMFQGGEPLRQETLPATFPREITFDRLADGDEVRIEIDGVVDGVGTVVQRTAATQAIGGQKLLLPVSLDAACLFEDEPLCVAPTTCVKGVCLDELQDPLSLEPYAPTWSGGGNTDVCKPQLGASPIVTVGQGQGDYLPVTDGDEVEVEAGPQGGYHVWVAVRMKNLLRSGSITSVSGVVPELGYDVPAFNVIFTFDPDEGGYCKLYGLRYRLDSETASIEELLGRSLDITVTITDKDGSVGTGTKTVQLSTYII